MLEPKSIVATPALTQPMQLITTPDLPTSMPPSPQPGWSPSPYPLAYHHLSCFHHLFNLNIICKLSPTQVIRSIIFFTDGVVQYSLPAVLMISITALVEPTCFTKAHHLPEWRVTITDELNALLKNGMRSLISLYPSQNMVGRKCVFRIKHYADDIIERYKAHLVAKGFHHQYGFAYHERFSPVVRPSTILLVLGLAVTHGRSI